MKRTGFILLASALCVVFFVLTVIPVGNDIELNDAVPIEELDTKAGIPSTEFPQFKGDAAKTSNTTATGPDAFNQLWTKNLAVTPTYGSPTVQYDQVYFTYAQEGGTQGTKCYDMSGNQVWTFPRGNTIGSPLIYNGRVYISTIAGSLYCIDANSSTTLGNEHWVYDPPGTMAETAGYYPGTGSPVTDGNMVYYSTMDPTGLHAVNIATGTKAWSRPLGGSTSTEASPAYADGRVFCGGGSPWGTGSNNLYCFDATTGATIWTFDTGGKACGTPAIVGNRLYYGSMNGKLYCMKADDTPVSNTSAPYKNWEYTIGDTLYASAAVGYGRIYIGDTSSSTNFHCFEDMGSSVTKKWTQSLAIGNGGGYGVSSTAVVTPDYLFVATSGSDIYCRNRNDGSAKWSHTYGAGWYGMTSPAVYQNKVFISIDDAKLYAIGSLVDLIPPKVLSSTPAADATGIGIDTQVSIKFNEALNVATVDSGSVYLKDSLGANVAGQVTTNMAIQTVFFTPDADLTNEETYTLTITTDVTDTSANNLDGDGDGTAEGPGVDEYVLSFTTAPKYPPVIGGIPTLHPTEDVLYSMNLSSIISDPDTPQDQLVLAENSSYATLSGFKLELLYPNGITYDVVNLSVGDGVFTVYKDIVVEVSTDNDAPVLIPVPAQTVLEDVPTDLDLEDYISDVDSILSEITLSDKSPFTEFTGLVITFNYPEGVTEDLVNVSVYDRGLYVYLEIDVTVTPVNDAPVIDDLNTAEAIEDETLEYYLGGKISDIDTPKEELIIEVDSPYVEVIGHYLNLTYPNGIEEDLLDVKVFDGELYDNTSLEVFITPVNDAPVWTGEVEIDAIEDEPGEFDLTDYISDVDNGVNSLRITADSVYGSMDKNEFKFLYPNGVLFEAVTFELTDGVSKVEIIGNVTVDPVNDPPELSSAKVTPSSGGNLTTEFVFSVVLKDIDIGDTRDALVKVYIDDKENDCEKLMGSPKAGSTYQFTTTLAEGNHSFYFTADDLDGGSATTEEDTVGVTKEADKPGGGGGGSSESSSMGLFIGVGIAVLVFVVLIIIVVIIVVVMMAKKKKTAESETPLTPGSESVEGTPDQQTMAPEGQQQQNMYQGQQDMYGGAGAQTTDPYYQGQQQGQDAYYQGGGQQQTTDQYSQQQQGADTSQMYGQEQQQAVGGQQQYQEQQIQPGQQQQQLPPATDHEQGY